MLLDGLNDKQIEAVKATEGRIQVVAGAGSGKTKVLAHRFAYLVNEIGIDPGNILCTTFTNKAAKEMASRISKMVPAGSTNDFICTIMGFCVKIIRRDCYRLGFPKNFTILDESDVKLLAKKVLQKFEMDVSVSNVNTFLKSVYSLKISCDYIQKYMLTTSPKFINSEDLSPEETFIHYQTVNYRLYFDDLVRFAIFLLGHFSDVKDYWQDKLNYIMVDEAQDCNTSEWNLIELLAGKYNNLFIVGDPDQAIYEWRGSRPTYFVHWKYDQQIVLAQNYRSTPNILNVANSIISNNENRIPKDLFTQKGSATTVVHFHAKSDQEEAEWITRQIVKLQKENNVSNSSFAILYRASYMSRPIEQVFINSGLQYTIWGGTRFFERKEIKDTLAYLSLIVNDDNLSFSRIVNFPQRGFGEKSLSNIEKLSEKLGISCFDVLRTEAEKLRGKKYTQIKNFIRLIDECREFLPISSPSEIINYVLKESHITTMYRDDNDTDRLENIEELINFVSLYEAEHADEDITLSTFLQDISLYTNLDKKSGDTIKLMTIHQSKGLEFPVVFICGLSEGLFPSHRSLRERKKAALEEERRLMYVATTRAENYLFLTESEGYNTQNQLIKFPSRFIMEIKKDLVVLEGEMDDSLWRRSQLEQIKINDEISGDTSSMLKLGDTVFHSVLGSGTIVDINYSRYMAKVRFGNDASSERYMRINVLFKVQNNPEDSALESESIDKPKVEDQQ